MDYSQIAILLLLGGLAIVFAEIFIPSGGILALMSVSCLLASVVCAWNAWWETSPGYFWAFLATALVAFPSATSAALYIFPRTSMGRAALLEPPRADELQPDVRHEERLRSLVGTIGTTAGLLTPGGIVFVDGERMHCESEGMLIEANTRVEIVDVRGARLVVREHVEAPAGPEEFGERPTVVDETDPPIDFEISSS